MPSNSTRGSILQHAWGVWHSQCNLLTSSKPASALSLLMVAAGLLVAAGALCVSDCPMTTKFTVLMQCLLLSLLHAAETQACRPDSRQPSSRSGGQKAGVTERSSGASEACVLNSVVALASVLSRQQKGRMVEAFLCFHAMPGVSNVLPVSTGLPCILISVCVYVCMCELIPNLHASNLD